MKFAQVPVGQRFELQGSRYLKTSPVVAVDEVSGRSRFVGKYVEVTLAASESPRPDRTSPETIDAATVLGEVEAFHARCLSVLDALRGEIGAEAFERARIELEEARERFARNVTGTE